MIKLTGTNGVGIWINPKFIVSILRDNRVTQISVVGETNDPYLVTEEPETIIQKISTLK